MLPLWSTLARHRQAFELFELKAQLQDQELSRPKKSPDACFCFFLSFFFLLLWEGHLKLTSDELQDIGFFPSRKCLEKYEGMHLRKCLKNISLHVFSGYLQDPLCFLLVFVHLQAQASRVTQGTTAKCLEQRLASEGATMGDVHGLTPVIVCFFERKSMERTKKRG